MADLFGRDIKLDDQGQALVAANGELVLTDGVETGVQDIRLRLGSPLGELFYDSVFGSLCHEFYLDELAPGKTAGFEAEVEQRIEQDPRVVLGSATCTVVSTNERGFSATAAWTFIDEDTVFNLVFSYDSTKKTMVINDVNPRTGL
ncbi:MAG: baseplate assembly protein [Desulfuromonadaceae bacterium]|nr:baseplate assembly protein [Desulfuromonadaceae bacterium]